MALEQPQLPYATDALEPHISTQTLETHYGKHHLGYYKKLTAAIADTDMAGLSLTEIVQKSDGGVFNNAAQIWNHSFYWQSMSPNGGGEPTGAVLAIIDKNFGSVAAFKEQFTKVCLGQFGSGWGWLVQQLDGSLTITSTSNAATPLTTDATPLLTCDVWEHAYYLDYQNKRDGYLEHFWDVINWDFIAQNLA